MIRVLDLGTSGRLEEGMKKIIIVLTIALAYCFLIFNINKRFTLNLNQFEKWIRWDEAGNIYMVQNNKDKSAVIKLGRDNEMTLLGSFYHNSGGQKTEITDIDVDKNNIYILFRYAPDSQHIRKWKIIKYSVADGEQQDLFETKENINIKRLSYQNEKLYVSAETEDKKVQIYELDVRSENRNMDLIMERTLTEPSKDILFDSGELYVLTCAGNVWSFQDNVPVQLNESMEGGCTAIAVQDRSLLLYSQREHTLYSNLTKVIETEDMAVTSMGGDLESGIHVLASDRSGNVVLYTLENGDFTQRTKMLNHSGKKKSAPFSWLLPATIVYFSVVAIIILMIWGYRKSRRLAVRISMITIEMAAILIAALTYAAYRNNIETVETERNNFCSLNNQIQMRLLEENSFGKIIKEKAYAENDFIYTFYQTEDYKKLDTLLSGGQIKDSEDFIESAQYLLYFDNNSGQAYILGSGNDDVIVGSYAGTVFSNEYMSVINSGLEQNDRISEIIRVKNQKYSVTVAPMNKGTQPGLYLVTAVSMQDISQKEKSSLITLVMMALCILIITIILLIISIQIALFPVKRLSTAMSQAAEGKIYEPDNKFMKIKIPEHEIGFMWISLKKMCRALQNKNYMTANILQSYYRFVPEKIEKLLNKKSVTDIKAGNMRYISGTLGLISIADNAELRRRNHTEYLKYINRCFRIISRNSEENQGILLSNDCNLSLVNVMFQDSAVKAFICGIDIIHAMACIDCQPLVLIHGATVLYGAAGTEEQIFPFVSSEEIEILSRFIPELRRTGIRMVVTESVIQKLKCSYSMRYIGYVISESMNRTFQLYEILDVYPEAEKNIRRRTDAIFQEGIQMFYRNDFYLARNNFSAVLKECPEDGIARWYLFTCETMLNAGDFEGIRHDLFAHI